MTVAAEKIALTSADRDDFKRQMVQLIPSLRSFARGLCGNREMADDLAQEAMMRAWAAQDSFTPGTNFRAWMFMIVRSRITVRRSGSASSPSSSST